MQEAIENFIDIQVDKKIPLKDIEYEIDIVEATALEKAREKQRYQWRKLSK